ncbi:MAG: hypothetical protein ABSH19_06270 [Opitutales bacterium]|jgi:hypothetical protein
MPQDSLTLLQRLDNLGRHTLRFFRRTRRALVRLLREFWAWILAWIKRVRPIFRWIAPSLILARRLWRARASTPVRFYLLDPSYHDHFGHYRNLAQRLAEECVRRGWMFIHITGTEDPHPADRLPFFHHPARPAIRTFIPDPQFPRRAHRLCRRTTVALKSFLSAFGILRTLDRWLLPSSDAYFYLPTGDLLYLWAFLNSSRLSPRHHLWCNQFYLPLHFESPNGQIRFARHAHLLARLRQSLPEHAARVHLTSDSPALLRHLSPILGSWPKLLPHPLLRPDLLDTLPAPENLLNRPHPCSYFGYIVTNPKRGWPIVQRLLRQHAGTNTRWFLGLNSKNREPNLIDEARQDAAAAGATLHFGYLPDDEYAVALDRSASVLLPYSPAFYAMISSARVIDALCHGCLPVVPARTWLAEVVQQVDFGLIVNDSDWPGVPARLASLDFAALWAARREPIRAFLAQFTARAFLDTLRRIND